MKQPSQAALAVQPERRRASPTLQDQLTKEATQDCGALAQAVLLGGHGYEVTVALPRGQALIDSTTGNALQLEHLGPRCARECRFGRCQ